MSGLRRARCEVRSRGLSQCNACSRQTSPIPGSNFASPRLPLGLWFRATCHLTQGKQGISSIDLGRRRGLAWLGAHAICPSDLRHDLAQDAKDWGAGEGQRAPGDGYNRLGLPVATRIRSGACDAATSGRLPKPARTRHREPPCRLANAIRTSRQENYVWNLHRPFAETPIYRIVVQHQDEMGAFSGS